MNTLGSSKRGTKRHARDSTSGKMALNLDLNFPPVECQPSEGTSGSRHEWIFRGTSFSGVPQPSHATGQQQGSSAPPSDRSNSSFIDVDLIEDEVLTLSSSRGFPLERNRSRRNLPVTVILDEDLETNLRRSVIVVEEQVVRSSLNTCKRFRSSMSRTNCDSYPDLEEEPNAKRKNVMKSKPEPAKAIAKGPTFTCPVCMDALVDASSTICGHIFCRGCIKTSIQTQKRCPTCRKKLAMSNFHRVYLPSD